jgi:hypothetical protein
MLPIVNISAAKLVTRMENVAKRMAKRVTIAIRHVKVKKNTLVQRPAKKESTRIVVEKKNIPVQNLATSNLYSFFCAISSPSLEGFFFALENKVYFCRK